MLPLSFFFPFLKFLFVFILSLEAVIFQCFQIISVSLNTRDLSLSKLFKRISDGLNSVVVMPKTLFYIL